ncbi:glycosyltransferase family protein [Flaviaesturariibacter terrae]
MSDVYRVYLYPETPFGRQEGANDYLQRLRAALSGPFDVINQPTTLGLFDLARKLPHTDIVYFNWIEDVADKRHGYVQLLLLVFILLYCRLTGKQVVWFVHNVLSHYPRNRAAKRLTTALMRRFADTVLAHAPGAEAVAGDRPVAIFDHPVPEPVPMPEVEPAFDLVLWGSVSPYKGVLEFVRLHAERPELRRLKVLIAGRFASQELYEAVTAAADANVTIRNRMIPEAEMPGLLAEARYVLFAYHSPSVLGSGALSKTLSYGKTVIGPDRGAFRALAQKGLIYTYRDLTELAALPGRLQQEERQVDPETLRAYALANSWAHFGEFLHEELQRPQERGSWGFVLR